jgi:hypothetical protein
MSTSTDASSGAVLADELALRSTSDIRGFIGPVFALRKHQGGACSRERRSSACARVDCSAAYMVGISPNRGSRRLRAVATVTGV